MRTPGGKRAFDVLAAGAGIALLLPLFAAIALGIRLAGPGPVLFRQERIGRFGHPFRMLKFRTMSIGAEGAVPRITVGEDRRITTLGRLLRRWKLDELPQLVNVVRGEMSLVGPRPEVGEFVALYSPDQREVLDLIPGVTDIASIAYRDESAMLGTMADPIAFYVGHVMPDKIRLNREYAAGATLASDLRVILATLRMCPAPGVAGLPRHRPDSPAATRSSAS